MQSDHGNYSSRTKTPSKTEQTVELVFLSCDKDVSCIIGLRGERIKEITEKWDVEVKVFGAIHVQRYLTVSGTPTSICACIEEICCCIRLGSGKVKCTEDLFKNNCGMVLLVSNEISGAIIGYNGQNVKHVRGLSDAAVRILREEQFENQRRLVVIEGCPMSVARAVQLVADIIIKFRCGSDAETRDKISGKPDIPPHEFRPAQPLMSLSLSHSQTFIFSSKTGFPISRKASRLIKSVRCICSAKVAVTQSNSANTQITVTGAPSSVCFAVRLINAEIASWMSTEKHKKSRPRLSHENDSPPPTEPDCGKNHPPGNHRAPH